MAKNMTISVPDDLHKDIQNAKGNFKTSAVCQEALRRAVKVSQALESKDVSALREKFKLERIKLFQQYWDEGFEDGRTDVFNMDYSTARKLYDLISTCDDYSDSYEYYASESTTEKYSAIACGELVLGDSHELGEDRLGIDARDMYLDGWCEAAHSIIKEVFDAKKFYSIEGGK